MLFFDCFSGAGGFRIAFEREGFKCVGHCEKDKWANSLYSAYFNTESEVYYKDATEIDTGTMPDFNIFLGGFPCQPFSIAGSRQGFKDTRGTLFFEIARICQDKKPEYIVLENVKGLLSHDNGRTFATIIGVLADIGYSVEWQVLNSKYFGVPQNRERVYIVGYFGKESGRKIFPVIRKTEKIYFKQGQDKEETHNIAQTLKAGDNAKWNGNYVICGNTNPSGRGMNGNIYDVDGLCPALTTNKGEGVKIGTWRTYKDNNGFREIVDGVCPTIPARAREDGSGQLVIFNNLSVRRLTPLECFRLQGFPDEMVEKAYEIGISDAQLYKVAGNAVTVNVVQEIAKRIKDQSGLI